MDVRRSVDGRSFCSFRKIHPDVADEVVGLESCGGRYLGWERSVQTIMCECEVNHDDFPQTQGDRCEVS